MQEAIDKTVFPVSVHVEFISFRMTRFLHHWMTYHTMSVKTLAAMIETNVQRNATGITVVFHGLLIGTGSVSVTPRTAF
jgi:hypothetical protein